jgi:hypothetical protein
MVAEAENGRSRMHIYHPDGDIRCLKHLDGRGDAPKFDDLQVP